MVQMYLCYATLRERSEVEQLLASLNKRQQ